VNNQKLEEAILGYAAKFSARYKISLYALSIEGNHIHTLAKYPHMNRAKFHQDFNSCVARAVTRHAPQYPGGRLWARRYSAEFTPEADDIESYFFYVVLQPVQDGLVDKISDYPGYNCFHDAITGAIRKFTVVNWAKFNEARRWDRSVKVRDFTETVELRYQRLPGYEHLTAKEYRSVMLQKLEQQRQRVIAERGTKRAVGPHRLKQTKPGAKPKFTKQSKLDSHRPRILCKCPIRRSHHTAWYFCVYFDYKDASRAYRRGRLNAKFPPGTYRPVFPTFRQTAPPQ
jgi:REP element-mobilizing transposase RayT